MTDWYVDASISGGNGTHPSTAYPSVTSITWAAGDRAWLRRSHYEAIADNVSVGASFSIGPFNRVGFVIGWPDSGDPFFDERPAAGVSSNWDADVPSTAVYSVYGLKFPTLSNSNNSTANGYHLAGGTIFANIAFQNSGGGTFPAWRARSDIAGVVVDNAIILAAGNPMARCAQDMLFNFGKMWFVLSGSNSNGFFVDANIRHVVFHELSVYSGGLLRGTNMAHRFNHVEFRTTSIDFFYAQGGTILNNAVGYVACSIGRMSGTEPYSGDCLHGGLNGWPGCTVDDYFGRGPFVIGGSKGTDFLCSSAQAMHNGARAMRHETTSEAAANQQYWVPRRTPIIRKPVSVTSGTALTMRLPIYADSTGVFSPAGGLMFASLLARGARPQFAVRSGILVGSPTQWSGTFISGGSAYLWEMKFFPQETGNVMLEIYPPMYTQATSGLGLTAYTLFSEPYSV